MNFVNLDDDSLRKVFSYLSFKDHFNLVAVDPRFENVIYTACKYIHVKLTVHDLKDQLNELNLESVFYKLITGKADDEFKLRFQIFNYVEKLHLEYKTDEPIDLSFMPRLKELNFKPTRPNINCSFVEGKDYPNLKTLFVYSFSSRYQTLFPNVSELGCEFIQNDIVPTDKVTLLCINTILPEGLSKFTNLKMLSLKLNDNLFNTQLSILLTSIPLLLTQIPTLEKLHINFFLRKNCLSIYTRAIIRLVNFKLKNKSNLELCIHLDSFTKDHPNESECKYRDSEISFFKENARNFLPHFVSFQINGVEITYDTIPDSISLFEMVGTRVINEKDLIPYMSKNIDKNINTYLKNLKTVKLSIGTTDFFTKLAKFTTKLKSIEINCSVRQELLDSIAIYYKDISSFSLYDQNGVYDIAFLKNMRHLRTLTLQIGDFKNTFYILDLQIIITNCIFLNFLTINSKHFEQIKDNLIAIYKERSIQYPFATFILTVKFDPVNHLSQTSYNKITDRFSIHTLPDLNQAKQ